MMKLPRFEKKLRVALDWSLDLVFSKDLVEFLTARSDAVSEHLPENGDQTASDDSAAAAKAA